MIAHIWWTTDFLLPGSPMSSERRFPRYGKSIKSPKIGEIKDGFVVLKDIAELIKQNPQHFKIKNNEVVKKTELEIETETKEAERQVKIAEIKAKLEEIDISSQRSSRAISLCILNEETPNPEDIEKLMDYENKAGELREELQELENIQNESEGINE